MTAEWAWARAMDEHERAVAEFVAVIGRVPEARWHEPYAPGKWSPADEALHVALAYEVGLAGVRDGTPMQLRTSPARAALLRRVVLPAILWTGRFPRVAAPREVRPPPELAAQLDPQGARARVEQAAHALADEAQQASLRPELRIMHAYFGPLTPLQGFRMLAAHTRHHARQLTARFVVA